MLALSADGRYLAFIANASGPNQVWIRPMDALEARALAGTDGATYPFWSPDGTYVGFFAQGKLKKMALGGGPPQILSDANDGRGGTWNRDGVIVFSAGPAGPIQQVAATGGMSTSVTSVGGPDDGHRFPVFLPDGVHFLFNASSNTVENSGLFVASLDRAEKPRRIVADQTNALYLPPSGRGRNGYLVFRRESTLVAQPFDSVTMTLSGEALPIAEEVPTSVNTGLGAFSIAQNGTVVYRTGGSAADRELVWVDLLGKRLKPVTRPQPLFGRPGLSPDGRLAAISIANGNDGDIWVQDLSRDVLSRLTFRPGLTRYPVWSPDGQRVAFSSQVNLGGTFDLYEKAASGTSPESLLLKGGINTILEDWSSDGRWLVFRQSSSTTALDLWLMPLGGDRKPIVYLQTPFSETNARFAPGLGGASRWMAYASNESGVYQIYVQAIPATGAKYQVSTSGGTLPMWRSDAKELYYVSSDQRMMAVPIALGTSVELGTPRQLFAVSGVTGYTPAAGGQQFLLNAPAGKEAAAPSLITVVLNWHEELNRLMPTN